MYWQIAIDGPAGAGKSTIAKEVAKILNIDESGYRIISNVGEDGGQVIPHLHFHLLWEICSQPKT